MKKLNRYPTVEEIAQFRIGGAHDVTLEGTIVSLAKEVVKLKKRVVALEKLINRGLEKL